MVDPKKKGKYIGMVGALLVHVAFIVDTGWLRFAGAAG